MIDYAIRARLLAVSAVSDLIGGTGADARIWPVKMPQRAQPVWPCLTYQIISGRPEYHIDSAAGVAEVRLQIDCWSAERPGHAAYDEVRALAEAVRGALSAYTGSITVGAVTDVVQSCFLENRRTLYEDAAQTHRESLDFLIGYTES